jgi:hypothetical protein
MKKSRVVARLLLVAAFLSGVALLGRQPLFAAHHESKPRIFGLYTADVQLGHGTEYNDMIEKEILPILKKHDVELIGAFRSGIGGPSNQSVLLMGYRDLAHLQAAHADPDLQKIQAEKFSQIRVLNSRVLIPTSFSPLH